MNFKKWLKVFLLIAGNSRGEVNFMGSTGGDAAAGATGDSGATDSGASSEGTGADSASMGTATINFPENVSQEVRDAADTTFKNFINTDGNIDHASLMKSYLHNSKLIGQDKVTIPTKESGAEEWQNVYRKLGVPESLDDYKVENNLSEGLTANEEMFNGFRETAHKAGVHPRQAQEIINYFNETVASQVKAQNEQAQADFTNGVNALKTEWGESFDKKCHMAKEGLMNFCTPEEAQQLSDIGFMDSPVVTKLFAKIGEALGKEDTFTDEGKGDFGMGPEQIQTEITNMYKDEAFTNSRHKDHKVAVEKFMRLNERLHGTKDANAGVTFGSVARM